MMDDSPLLRSTLYDRAVAIGVQHARWQERPLAVVVRHPGVEEEADRLGHRVVAWRPPKTGTDTFDNKAIRSQYSGLDLGDGG